MVLTIVGLGPGSPEFLTRQAWDILSSAETVYLRTAVHPTVRGLPVGPKYRSFDHLYDEAADFAAVYESIVNKLVGLVAEQHEVIYAVPGDPTVGEETVTLLLAVCRTRNIPVRIIHGVSFIEPTLALLGIDGISGIQVLDALDVAAGHHPLINPDRGALIAQVYDRAVASDVKLTLMNQYPAEHPVTLVQAAGTAEQRVETVPLYEIDHVDVAHLTTLYVPPFDSERGAVTSFEGFQETIAHLRAPEGCPWDREQTHESLRSYLVEETYEVLDAIDSGDSSRLREELGDLLLQIVLHSQIAVDDGEFSMPEVIRLIDAKIKRRHPHVWGNVDVNNSPARVEANWEDIKARERAENGQQNDSLLDGVSKSLPALAQSYEYDRRAARVGFDWPDVHGVVDKIREELAEVVTAKGSDERFYEIGDLLLAVSALARWLEIAPEDALRAANQRFYRRFIYVEQQARVQGLDLRKVPITQLDALWDEAKHATDGKQP